MVRILSLAAAIFLSLPLIAEEREIAAQVDSDETAMTLTASAGEPSFFQPKTLEDINAMATLENGFEASLTQEISN
jgi:hypothetical protein